MCKLHSFSFRRWQAVRGTRLFCSFFWSG